MRGPLLRIARSFASSTFYFLFSDVLFSVLPYCVIQKAAFDHFFTLSALVYASVMCALWSALSVLHDSSSMQVGLFFGLVLHASLPSLHSITGNGARPRLSRLSVLLCVAGLCMCVCVCVCMPQHVFAFLLPSFSCVLQRRCRGMYRSSFTCSLCESAL